MADGGIVARVVYCMAEGSIVRVVYCMAEGGVVRVLHCMAEGGVVVGHLLQIYVSCDEPARIVAKTRPISCSFFCCQNK